MGRCIIKIKDKYLVWSTIVDAPVTYGMTLEQLTEWIKEEYGRVGMEELPKELAQIEKQGTSYPINYTLKELVSNNRAGEGETRISLKKIYERYCTKDLS